MSMPDIDWMALLQVSLVTVIAAVTIATLMALAIHFLSPVEGASQATTQRSAIGIGLIVLITLVVLFGIYLMVPYFH